jgi:hypothetical protein
MDALDALDKEDRRHLQRAQEAIRKMPPEMFEVHHPLDTPAASAEIDEIKATVDTCTDVVDLYHRVAVHHPRMLVVRVKGPGGEMVEQRRQSEAPTCFSDSYFIAVLEANVNPGAESKVPVVDTADRATKLRRKRNAAAAAHTQPLTWKKMKKPE